MKQLDTRKLGSESRNFLRQLVVRLREHGMRAADIAQVVGAHPSTIRAWLAKAKRKGDASLDEKRRGRPLGACRKLTAEQEIWIREQIVAGGIALCAVESSGDSRARQREIRIGSARQTDR